MSKSQIFGFYFLIFSISIVKSNYFIIYSSNYCFFMQKYKWASLGICFVGTKASGLIVRVYLRHKTHISRKEFDIVLRIENQSALLMLLTYFSPMSQFYIPWKRQKTIRFQWVYKCDIGLKWVEKLRWNEIFSWKVSHNYFKIMFWRDISYFFSLETRDNVKIFYGCSGICETCKCYYYQRLFIFKKLSMNSKT